MRKSLKKLVLAAVMSGSLLLGGTAADAAIHVNPVANISDNFIMGADVSMLKQLEVSGAKFYDNSVAKDGMQILKDHGVNWVRLRIWNNPKDSYGGGGDVDAARAMELAERANKLGLKVLIDFHYSDFWADPGKQIKPKVWADASGKKLEDNVYKYTKEVMQGFKDRGIKVDMVQIGNELNNGMMWPDGKTSSEAGYKTFAGLMKAGLKAVRDVDTDRQTKLMIHLANGGDNGLYRSFFDNMLKENVTDYDIIGLSFYPCWHGTVSQLQNNMNDVSARYNKDVIVVETAHGWTTENGDSQKNAFGIEEEKLSGYKASVQGQATAIRDVVEAVTKVPNNRGLGIFYWEPDWIPNEGAPWKTGEGNEWENQAMFDFKGQALESIDVFNMVRDTKTPYIEHTIQDIYPVSIDAAVNKNVSLPGSVKALYTDDSVKDVAVVWEKNDIVFAKTGKQTIKGTVSGSKKAAYAVVNVIEKNNVVKNADFETGNLGSWTISGDSSAVNIVGSAGDVRGTKAMHYWADNDFKFTVTQSLTGLANGKYTVGVWTQGGGGEKAMNLYAEAGGKKFTAAILNDGWNNWKYWVIKDVEVKDGKLTIGVDTDAPAGSWGSIDDFEAFLQK